MQSLDQMPPLQAFKKMFHLLIQYRHSGIFWIPRFSKTALAATAWKMSRLLFLSIHQGFSSLALLTFWDRKSFVVGGLSSTLSVSSMSSFYPLVDSSGLLSQLWQPRISPDVDKCLLGNRISLSPRSIALYRYHLGPGAWAFHLPSCHKVLLAMSPCPEETFNFSKRNPGGNIFKVYKRINGE